MQILSLLELYMPDFIRRRLLVELIERTAAALSCTPPQVKGSCHDLLIQYAEFTARQVELIIEPQRATVRAALRHETKQLGAKLRQILAIRSTTDRARALRLIYRGLGIDLELKPSGDVIVQSCMFSRYYDSPTCQFMSALDEGLMDGLSGGAQLSFTTRITENAPCCRATVTYPQQCSIGGSIHA